jgi:hypothetical protein
MALLGVFAAEKSPRGNCSKNLRTQANTPAVVPEQDLMRRNLLFEDSMRWARCLCEVLAAASALCPDSARAAYAEIVNRLQVLLVFQS